MFNTNLVEYINRIQDDVNEFVATELQVYLSSNNNQDFSKSVIANIAMFDIEGINTEKGYKQMAHLLGDHYDQMIERRMKQLLHKLYIKHGKRIVNKVIDRVLETMPIAYPSVYEENVRSLHKQYNTFWLVPFIKEAYNTIVLTVKK